jgi:hypothetical protein
MSATARTRSTPTPLVAEPVGPSTTSARTE